MSNKFLSEKTQLRRYLELRGVSYNSKRKTWRCPGHDDATESATLYENADGHLLFCPVCSASRDIFQVAELIDHAPTFRDQLKSVRAALGIADDKPEKKTPHPFPPDRKQEFEDKIKSQCAKHGEIVNSWKYLDRDGATIGLDVRYEKQGERKVILTFWFDGRSLRWADAPVLLYGAEKLAENILPVVIHEGAKCADIGRDNLPGFLHVSWSGGSGKAHLADWSELKNFDVFILRDNDEAGLKAAQNIKKKLSHAKIVNPPTPGKGDDIEQFLQAMSAPELSAHILNAVDVGPVLPTTGTLSAGSESLTTSAPPNRAGLTSTPFKILGIGDDGKAGFITEEGRLRKWDLDSMSKNRLTVLTGRAFWSSEYPNKNSADWDAAIDDLIRISQRLDFDESLVRGRGAWKDGEKYSFHDGVKTHGEWDENKIYIRCTRKDIGIEDAPASTELRKKMKDVVFGLSFETPADAVRCLAWSCLAPFAGALTFRPSMLLTGESGSGKTEVQKKIMNPLSLCIWVDTRVTTTAGLRGKIKYDSTCVIFDEAGKENEKMKANFDEILAFIRSNYSIDSPDGLKGTKDQGYVNYKMNSMFALASTDPTIENIQDENRILRISFVKSGMSAEAWQDCERRLLELYCVKNCRAVRSFVWRNLKVIEDLAYKIVRVARSKSGRDYRSSYAEMLLASAFMIVWAGADNPSDEQINDMLEKYYRYQPAEEHRNEAEEMVNRIMDEPIEILHDNRREKLSILECLNRVYHEKSGMDEGGEMHLHSPAQLYQYRLALAMHGIKLTKDFHVAIQSNHHFISKITGHASGYSKIFKRHPGLVDSNRNEYFNDGRKPRRSCVLSGIIKRKPEHMTEDEKLGEVM